MLIRFINWVKLAYYKRLLLKLHLRYNNIRDEYSCGIALAEYISPRLRAAKSSLNKVISKIKELDPKADLSKLD